MFLKRIELQGFKSFADKAIIQFDADVIGIVGPNGCGKSNINDAIRWVLGEQSVKSLRGNNMCDVIFNGSSHRKAINTAEVTLIFDNSKHHLNIDFEEVEITRRLHRSSGEGEYFINKTPCRLKDIHNLVMDSGLGKDSLSIISQGNISSFAEAKPEERRALFEEAAGVAKYKKRKQESLVKLNKTEDNLMRLEDIVIELQRQVAPLKKQAEKAEIYKNKKQELEAIEISVIVDEIEMLMKSIEEVKDKLFYIESQKAIQETTIQVEDSKNSSIKKEMYQLDQEVNHLQEEYTTLINHIAKLEAQKIELDEKRKYALEFANTQDRLKELKKMMEEANYEFQDRKQRMQDLKTQYALKKQQGIQIESQYSQLHQLFSQEQSIYTRYQNKKEVLENIMKQPFQHQQGVQAIMQNKQALNGVLGVVSSLLQAENKFEEAIANAIGGASYHIVTENEDSARHAISFLKKNQSGRATFLPLTVMKERYLSNDIRVICENIDGFLGSADEFVTNAPQFDGLKKALLGNVLVCQQLHHANELAKILKHQYKIVTLDGDIVHRGGSMTGGKLKNNHSPYTTQKEFNQIKKALEDKKLQLKQLQSQLYEQENKKQKMQEELVQLQIAIAQLEPILENKQAKYEKYKLEYMQLAPQQEIDLNEIQEDDLIVKLSQRYLERDEVLSQIKNKRERRMKLGSELERKEVNIRQIRRDLNQLQSDENILLQKQVKNETRLESVLERLSTTYEMTYEFAKTQKKEIDIAVAKGRVVELRKEIASLGNVNLNAPMEYEEVLQRYEFLLHQKQDLIAAKDKILAAISEMDQTMITQFEEMFQKINSHLNDVFQSLFGGGEAKLFMVNPEDVLNTGIDINVQPPGKTVQNIRLFSGGEKALIAICVLFSILRARTIPLCIFDEVEAALDQANVERFAKYISKFKNESQFIVVTHRPGTMAQCDALYGVTMQQSGVSQLLKVQMQDAIDIIAKNQKGDHN